MREWTRSPAYFQASLKEVATIFVENGISGLAVCDAQNRVVGVVSEGDVLYKETTRGTLSGDRSGGCVVEIQQ